MEKFGQNLSEVHKYPTEGALLVDDLLEEAGLSRTEFNNLSADEKKTVMGRVREVLKQPGVAEILANRDQPGLSPETSKAIRDVIGLGKWNDLSEFVSYIKTLLGEKHEAERVEEYSKHLAFGVDSNEIKRVLSNIYDVLPARIDTDIKHQSTMFYRAVVEIASNALDASVKHRSPIGRFGIGFYQILNHIQDPNDRVIVKTKSADSPTGIKVEFRNHNGNIDFKVSEDDSVESHGTIVELKSKEFKAKEAGKIILEYFSHTQDAEIIMNGEQMKRWRPDGGAEVPTELPIIDVKIEDGKLIVTDTGIGMNTRVIFEKLLVPKLSDKPPVYEIKQMGEIPSKIYYEKGESENVQMSEILIQVGGIVIERVKTEGVSIAKTLVIDLPPSTILGEQRDQVEINRETVDAMKSVIDQVIQLPRPDCFQVINSLGAVCREYQNRSKLYGKEDNMFVYLQDKVRDSFPGVGFLPNKREFVELDLDSGSVAFLDSKIYQSPIDTISGLTKVPQWVSNENTQLFEAKFKEGSTLGIISDGNFLIIDERVQASKNSVLVNKAIDIAAGWGKGKISDLFTEDGSKKEREIKKFESLEDLVSEQWEHFSFDSKETALRQARVYQNKNPLVTKVFTKQVLSGLSTMGAVEAWDILHWYVNGDSREVDIKIAEIEQLAKNIDVLLANPELVKILKSTSVPILSMFEKYSPETPEHVDVANKRIKVDGKDYFCKVGYRSNQKQYITEDGHYVSINPSDSILFKDSKITVYKDRIQDTQTGEVINQEIPIISSWGTIDYAVDKNGKKIEGEFSFIPSKLVEEDNKKLGEVVKKDIWEVRSEERPNDPYYPVIYIEGEKFADLNELREKAGIEKGNNLGRVYKMASGEPLLVFQNTTLSERRTSSADSYYIDNDGYGSRHRGGESETKESFSLVDNDGRVVWRFNPSEWPDKVAVHENYSYHTSNQGRGQDEYDKQHIEWTRKSSAQCIPISYDRPITDEDFVAKIVKYYYINNGRFRETVAFINAKGETVLPSEIKEVNPLTLGIKYTSESSCPCCGISDKFGRARFDPFPENVEGSFIKSQARLPVEIYGEFTYDSTEEEWRALARSKRGKRDEGNIYLAIFDKEGSYLRADKIGFEPVTVHSEFDFRNQKKHLRHRLPDRLKNVETRYKDESYWSYESELNKFISVGDRVLLNCRIAQTYDSSYQPILQEADNVTRKLFDLNKGGLISEHAEILKNFLLKFPVLDKEKMERVMYRTMECRDLAPKDLEFLLPVFYELDYIPPNFLDSGMVGLLRQMSYLDSERFVKLFTIIVGSVQRSTEEGLRVTNKIIKFYGEKLQSESITVTENLIESLSSVEDYSNAVMCSGFNLIRNKVSVPQSEIPRALRPFITFIQREDDELAYKNVETIKIPDGSSRTIRLSEIIQWKRLQESEARKFKGDVDMLGDMVKKVVDGKKREHIVREITHAVHFQALNSTDLYIRELVQNAVDAMQSTDMDKDKRSLEIIVSATDEKEIETSFHDPIGMDISTLLNYFLVPGESTKRDKNKNFIGFYGQGVYTLFKNFKEVNIKTGVGDGTVWYLTIKPIAENGMVSDVSIDFHSAEGDFKGTVVNKTQTVENPYVEAAYIKDAVMTLTSALSDSKASIVYQGEKINSEYDVLSERKVGELGKVTIYRNPNNIVTHHGLYVKDIGNEYSQLVPEFMSGGLKGWGGIAIDLPKGIELTRSRQDIASKDKVKDILNPEIQISLVTAYFDSFIEKMKSGQARFPFKSLPYDYFSQAEHYELSRSYKKDIEDLVEGRSIEKIEKYAKPNEALKLMSLLPLFKVKDVIVSLDQIRQAFTVEEKTYPFDQDGWDDKLPDELTDLMSRQRGERNSREVQEKQAEKDAIGDTTLESIFEQATGELKEWLEKNKDNLHLLDKMTKVFIDTINKTYNESARGLFFYKRTDVIAHAQRGGDLSWNLSYLEKGGWRNALKEIESFKGEKGGKIDNLLNTLGILAHEYGHILENFQDWSHDPKHDKEQAMILIQFIIQNGPERILSVLREQI